VVGDDELYRKHADDLTKLATGLVGPSDAADVVSAAVVGCVSSRGWATADDRRAYLFKSVVNEAAKWHRSNARRRVREASVRSCREFEIPLPRPEVIAAIRELSFRQRAVIVLTYWADLTPRDVANALGISEGTVKRHLARARGRLKEVLHDD
jgi:RNA polymerase sigma factor (sigma-70 family)